MYSTTQSRFQLSLWLLAPLYFVLHGVIATALPDRLAPLSTLCIILVELATVAAILRHSSRAESRIESRMDSRARTLWWLLASSILLHSVAMSVDMFEEATGTLVLNHVPGLSIFFSMLCNVPVLVAVSMQFDRRILSVARAINAVLSLAIGALLYLQIFSLLSLTGSNNPADAVLISHWFFGIDVFLATAATIRWAGSDQLPERSFFRIFSIFCWIDTILPDIHNRILIHHDYVWADLLVAAPYVALFILVQTALVRTEKPSSPRLVRLVQSGSPIFLSIALILAAIITSRTHFYVGLTAALLSVVGYGILNITVQSRIRETEELLLASKTALEELVGLDSLTGIPNRRAFDGALSRECSSSRRTLLPVSLLMIDVDHFKLLNDSQGHLEGDAYLILIAATLRAALPRATDFIARYGGEEFCVILPATGQEGAAEVATRLRSAVADLGLSHPVSEFGVITVSIGFSTFDGSQRQSQASLIQAADQALYGAKRLGRNRTEGLSIDALEV